MARSSAGPGDSIDYRPGHPIRLQAGKLDSLHEAAAKGDLDQVKYLLGTDTRVNRRDAEGWTPLHHAALHETVVQILEAHGGE
jgi:ankyrin repeat protein